jgi:hypothetical protein
MDEEIYFHNLQTVFLQDLSVDLSVEPTDPCFSVPI